MDETRPGLAPVLQPRWPIGGFGALVSLRVSITSKKAEHALLLLGGQWTISLFLKDRAGERRRGGNESSLASLGRPQAATSISG